MVSIHLYISLAFSVDGKRAIDYAAVDYCCLLSFRMFKVLIALLRARDGMGRLFKLTYVECIAAACDSLGRLHGFLYQNRRSRGPSSLDPENTDPPSRLQLGAKISPMEGADTLVLTTPRFQSGFPICHPQRGRASSYDIQSSKRC